MPMPGMAVLARGCGSSWEQGELLQPARGGPAAWSVCVHTVPVPGGASYAPDLDALAVAAGLLA